MASPFTHSHEITKYDWLLDSGTLSHLHHSRGFHRIQNSWWNPKRRRRRNTCERTRNCQCQIWIQWKIFHSPAAQYPIHAKHTELFAILQLIRWHKQEGGFLWWRVLAKEQRWKGHRERVQTQKAIFAHHEGYLAWTRTIKLCNDQETHMGRMAQTFWTRLDFCTANAQ